MTSQQPKNEGDELFVTHRVNVVLQSKPSSKALEVGVAYLHINMCRASQVSSHQASHVLLSSAQDGPPIDPRESFESVIG